MINTFILKIKILLFKFLKKDSMKYKIKLWRLKGYIIGNNCRIFSDLNSAEPYLVNIGDNVTISTNVTLLTHDNSIIKASNNKYTDLYGKIVVHDNCFLGNGSILLPGITLAKGTIIAAGSVITKSILKENMVVGGNPAKYISSVEEFYKKNEKNAFNTNLLNYNKKRNIINKNQAKLISRKELK